MDWINRVILYIALPLAANIGLAGAGMADISGLEALRQGEMRKLVVHAEPKPVSGAAFWDEDGRELTLEGFRGRHLLLNFWATWCAPCREEMPALDALQREFGGERFQVVTVATGRHRPAAIRRFFESVGVTALPRYRDDGQALAREMGVFGLPVSVIVDAGGQEVARLQGGADWSSPGARAIVRALVEPY
ncbi:MAG: TlpA disulfide reductase family protein [Rhodobacter sp.]|nr:TlpA disulfide reductase family protein [Rhodobacter sp.]MCY4168331.1 TlpA disulfide reductase family protein [Rhodobacter sp.]